MGVSDFEMCFDQIAYQDCVTKASGGGMCVLVELNSELFEIKIRYFTKFIFFICHIGYSLLNGHELEWLALSPHKKKKKVLGKLSR